MRPRTRPRRSSECNTSRAEPDGSASARREQTHPARQACPAAELEPPDRVGGPDRAERARTRPVEIQGLERLAAEGRGQAPTIPQRRQVAADELDLAGERRVVPSVGASSDIAESASEPKRVQRQCPVGRWRWGGSEGTARWEEVLERRAAFGRSAAEPRHRGLVGSGRANDRRHAVMVGGQDQRPLIGRSTLRWAAGRHSRRHGPCG